MSRSENMERAVYSPSRTVVIVAWITILAVSLPEIILREMFHYVPSEGLRIAFPVGVAFAGLALTFLWKSVRRLREFFGLLLVLVVSQWLVYTRVAQLPFLQSWMEDTSFTVRMIVDQSMRLTVTGIIIVLLFILKKKASAFYLTRGYLAAPVTPVRLLGTKPTLRWNVFGRNLAILISLGTLAFLSIAGRPSVDVLPSLVPLIPVIVLTAALNAFNEEVTFKSSFLSVLEGPAGRKQGLLLVAVFFGFAHFYGMPYGIVGVLMAGVLGWLLGKSMLETGGLFWAWFIHFCQDILIFGFIAAGTVALGGG